MNIQNLKKSKKGFTLVEIIVVLVIIAILAAIAIPAMVGWIDKANARADYAEARTVLLAAQTIASEQYATSPAATSIDEEKVETLSGVDDSLFSDIVITANTGKVASFTYTKDGHELKYEDGAWTSNKD